MTEEIVYLLDRLAADWQLRKSYSQKLRKLVDGQGALRIARELCEFRK